MRSKSSIARMLSSSFNAALVADCERAMFCAAAAVLPDKAIAVKTMQLAQSDLHAEASGKCC